MRKTLPIISILLLAILVACSAASPQTDSTNQSYPNESYPNQSQSQGQANYPLTEASVPRVSVSDAKAAFDNGEAIIVDVRNADAYTTGHIPGSISIPLGFFETDPSGLNLDKAQWIITYCT